MLGWSPSHTTMLSKCYFLCAVRISNIERGQGRITVNPVFITFWPFFIIIFYKFSELVLGLESVIFQLTVHINDFVSTILTMIVTSTKDKMPNSFEWSYPLRAWPHAWKPGERNQWQTVIFVLYSHVTELLRYNNYIAIPPTCKTRMITEQAVCLGTLAAS